MGTQSFSFRNFDINGAIDCLQELGQDEMEFCAVHFPPDASHAGFGAVRNLLSERGVRVPCFGVEGFSTDEAANRARFDFAKALGVIILSADPEPGALAQLDALCEEYRIAIAIHNHGPESRYSTIDDVLKAVAGRHPLVGACVDTGHFIRSGEKPEEAIRKLDDRVKNVHLKDWVHGGEETILGEGDLDLDAVAASLKAINYEGPIMMEYENSPDNPVDDMRQGWKNWQAAAQRAGF